VFNRNTVNENILFQGLNLNVNDGDFITFIGSNGAGKSTLMNVIAGSELEDEGIITLNKNKLHEMPEYKRSKLVGRVFQDPSKGAALNMTILENLSMAYNKGKSFNLSLGIEKKNTEMFIKMLSQVGLGLEDKLHTKVGLLSGGQRQALCIMMSIMHKPQVLLLDEPTAALDPKTSEIIVDYIEKVVTENKITTLMITHNLNHAIRLGNRLIMMNRGSIIADISGKEKSKLTVEMLIERFNSVHGKDFLSDRSLLL
jgi:putative ABC transport system ATP-binding protein